MRTLRFLRALLVTNFKASAALRGAFLLQAGFMALNNFIFFADIRRKFGVCGTGGAGEQT